MGEVRLSVSRVASLIENRAGIEAKVDPRVLGLVERGGAHMRITHDELTALASVLKRPWPYLLLDEPEEPLRGRGDFRRRDTGASDLSEAAANAIVDASWVLETAEELFPDEAVRLPDRRARVGADPEIAGARLRAHLLSSAVVPAGRRDEWAVLRDWVDAIHRTGVYYSTRTLDDPSVRGFCISLGSHAIVVADTRDSAPARLFTAIHEYVHLWLNEPGVCGFDDESSTEWWCNRVAAACLLPVDVMARANWSALRAGGDSADSALAGFSKSVGVSQQAILIRAKALHLLDERAYGSLEDRRASRRRKKGNASGGNFYRNAASRVSWRFATGVVDLYENAGIDRFTAAASIGVADRHFPGVVREVHGHRRS